MVTHDPKHGRWILPLIIAAMVVLTYTFVNGIEPADNPRGEPDTQEPPFPTTPTSSTTTLPADVAAFMVTLDIFDNQLDSYADSADRINSRWETREETFAGTQQALIDLQAQLEQWENDVAQIDGVPPALAEGHVALVVEVGDLAPKAADIILGLEAPDDGTLRRAAVAEFAVEAQQVRDAIQAIRDAATAPTADEESTTTSQADSSA